MTVFKNRSFCYPKDPESPEQNQDSYQVSDSTGLAVVADGVSSAIFSAAWSNILTKHVLQDRPDPTNQTDFAHWLSNLRLEWEQSIDTSNLSWFQRPKMASGAFSTLIWVQVREIAPPKPGSNLWNRLQNPDSGRRCFHVKGHCIGDSCLFHVRPGRTDSESFSGADLYRVLPLTKSSEFDMPPIVIGSKDLGRDDQIQFQPIDFLAQEGDLVILATDAVSQWLLRCYETQAFPCWDLFWNLTQEMWGQELDALRSAGEIRYDDSTLVLLQLGNSNTFLNQAASVQEPKAEEAVEVDPEPEEEAKPNPQIEEEPTTEPEIEPEAVFEDTPEAVPESVPEPDQPLEETAEVFQSEEPTESVQTHSVPVSKPLPQKKPVSNPGSAPQPGGFQYRMASSTTARKFESAQETRPQPAPRKPSNASQVSNTPKQEVRQSPALTSADADKLAENWKQLKESSSQIAGILGGQISEKISEGMSRLGSNLNEGVSQLSESAKPKIQSMTQRFVGLFTRKKNEQPENEEEPEEKPAENKTPARVIDPNRRRFYNPPPRE
ncbi:MAG: hypothetical protein Q4A17_07665 [Thermoguttaceae bacterium]|nr:hypothetical protein [Thermoguttaceae bacterium]